MSAAVHIASGPSMPSDMEAERALIGAVLASPDAAGVAVAMGLKPEHFWSELHGRVWERCAAVFARVGVLDEHELQAEMRKHGDFNRPGMDVAFMAALDRKGFGWNVRTYAQRQLEGARQRRIIMAAQDVAAEGMKLGVTADDLAMFAERQLRAALMGGRRLTLASGQECADDAWTPDAVGRLLTTGLGPLDEFTGGIPRGEPTVIGGRPGMGKSSVAVGFVAHGLNLDEPRKQLVISAEMRRKKFMRLLVAQMADLDVSLVVWALDNWGDVAGPLRQTLSDVRDRLNYAAFSCDGSASPTAAEIVGMAHEFASKHGAPDLIVIDHWQCLSHPGSKGDRKDVAESESSRQCRQLAKEMDCGLVILSQLLKSSTGRPGQSDIRECDALNQDAGAVMFPYRPNRPQKGERGMGAEKAEVIVDKFRDGETGAVDVTWEGKKRRYV